MDIKKYKMQIPEYVLAVMNALLRNGFEVYAVGGCVRDSLLGTPPHDFDLTTSAAPEQMKRVFADFTVIETGLKHGTLTVKSEGRNVEVTTFRVDGEYSDHRRPDRVEFTSDLRDDLARRDFTVNAFAYSPQSGLVDEFRGIYDLENRIIRCVGEPDRRFEEDALRILRGLRFAARLGFSIERETAGSMIKNRGLLKNVSGERIFSELCGILAGDGETVTGLLLEFREVFAEIIPELEPTFDFDQKSPYHQYDVYTHTAKAVGYSANEKNVRLAALFHDISKPRTFFTDGEGMGHFYGHPEKSAEIARNTLKRLHADNRTVLSVEKLVRRHDDELLSNEKSVGRMISDIGEELFFGLCELKKADLLAHAVAYRNVDGITEAETLARKLLAQNKCFSLKQLKIKGEDILKLGVPFGGQVGKILETLLEEVVDGKIPNDRNELLKRAKAIKKP